jgi:hypothetical protein
MPYNKLFINLACLVFTEKYRTSVFFYKPRPTGLVYTKKTWSDISCLVERKGPPHNKKSSIMTLVRWPRQLSGTFSPCMKRVLTCTTMACCCYIFDLCFNIRIKMAAEPQRNTGRNRSKPFTCGLKERSY